MNVVYAVLDVILPFEWAVPLFMKNAFLAILFAAPLFGILGTFVVSNRMAFFSDAIGHSALTGVAIGVLLGIKEPVVAMVLFSLFLGIAIITVKSKDSATTDTVIGIFSSTASATGIVLLSRGGSFAKYSKYLIGDILSIDPHEILLLLVADICLAIIWIFFFNVMLITSINGSLARSRGIKTFWIEQLFAAGVAIIVTVSIRWTGLLVINSLLVLPASAARNVSSSSCKYLFSSIGISLGTGLAGLILSYYAGTAAGATIVLMSAAVYVITLFIKPNRQYGLSR